MWDGDKLTLADGDAARLGPSQLLWTEESDNSALVRGKATLPVYLNSDRSDVLFTVDLPIEKNAGVLITLRAVCLKADG